MKRFVCILTAVLLLLSLSGCGITTSYWEFQYSVDNVKEIKIIDVKRGGGYVDSEEDYTVLKVVDETDYAGIMDDIQTIGYYCPYLGSNPASPYGKSIMVVFESGEYDVISATGPEHYQYSEERGSITKILSFVRCRDKEQYNQMIDKWLDGAETTEGQTE
ncbi:MAG: hypothetical protein IJ363_01035 [Clostridia bacterium]|nr:hypothetical protein [Clostridia bacterium]